MSERLTIERLGRTFEVETVPDECMGEPWNEHDGHGPVSDWTRRAKAPGELVLVSDRGAHRYYDFAEACGIARRDGWWNDVNGAGPQFRDMDRRTPRQIAADAARADFERLRRFCSGDWGWMTVTVRPAGACRCCGAAASIGGVESDCGNNYVLELADDLVRELES